MTYEDRLMMYASTALCLGFSVASYAIGYFRGSAHRESVPITYKPFIPIAHMPTAFLGEVDDVKLVVTGKTARVEGMRDGELRWDLALDAEESKK